MNRNIPFLTATILILISAASTARAASDTDVQIIRATRVIIETDRITIDAEAVTTIRTISANHDPGYKGVQFLGRPASVTKIKSDKATFVVTKPKGPERGWEMTLAAAKALKEGKEIGRIGYYQPNILIKNSLIDSIKGRGYIYPKQPMRPKANPLDKATKNAR